MIRRRRKLYKAGVLGGGGGTDVTVKLLDTFSSTLAAGSVNGTTADTGQVRTVTDTSNRLSVTANGVEINVTTGAGDPALYYPLFARRSGRTVAFRLNPVSGFMRLQAGWDSNTAGSIDDGVYMYFSNVLRYISGTGIGPALNSTYTQNTVYDVAAVMRSAGAFVFIRGGVFTDWTLMVVSNTGATDMYPALGSYAASADMVAYISRVTIGDLASFLSPYAYASSRKAISVNNDIITASSGNSIIEHTITAATGVTQELMVRRVDDDNCIIIRMDQAGSTLKVIKKEAGVETELDSDAQTWTNGASYRVQVSLYGSSILTVVNLASVNSTTSTYNQAEIGVKASHAGINLIAWPLVPSNNFKDQLDLLMPA